MRFLFIAVAAIIATANVSLADDVLIDRNLLCAQLSEIKASEPRMRAGHLALAVMLHGTADSTDERMKLLHAVADMFATNLDALNTAAEPLEQICLDRK